MSIETMSFIAGGILVGVALLGGGIEIRDLKVPSIGRVSRILAFLGGVAFIILAILLNAKLIAPHDKTAVQQPSVAPSPTPTAAGTGTASDAMGWLSADQYQKQFDTKNAEGFYPSKIFGRCNESVNEFRAEWKRLPEGNAFFSYWGMTEDFYEKENAKQKAKGYSLEWFSTYKNCAGTISYQAVWVQK